MSVIKDRILFEAKDFSSALKCDGDEQRTSLKRKPDILLNLNHKGTIFADQTPTPTRFIRNCEEVGLFQDLQNVNPFDETFRRAAEAVKNGEQPRVELLSCASQPDDTLHTPNVFPLLPEPPPQNATVPCQTINNSSEVTGEEVPKPPRKYTQKRKLKTAARKIACREVGNNTDICLEGSKAQLGHAGSINDVEQPHYVIVNRHVTFKLPIPRLPLGPKVYAPNYFSTFSKNASAFTSDVRTPGLSKRGLSKKVGKKWSVADESHRKLEPVMSKSEIMERNRVAAIRTREKKKHYVAHLEKMKRVLVEKTTELEQLVQMLVSENLALKESLGKCRCSKTSSVGKDFAQQTEDLTYENCSQGTQLHPICENDYLDVAGGKQMGRAVSESSCKEIGLSSSASTKELEKEVFYATLPKQHLNCEIFEPTFAASTVRKPFKKRNLNQE